MTSRNGYIAKMKGKLDLLDAQIKIWQAKSNQASFEAKIEYNKKIAELDKEHREGKAWLDKVLNETTDNTWDSIKEGFSSAYERVKKVLS